MSPSRKQRSCAIVWLLAIAAAPGALAATTVTYDAGGTSPGMNVVDDAGNAADLVVTGGTRPITSACAATTPSRAGAS